MTRLNRRHILLLACAAVALTGPAPFSGPANAQENTAKTWTLNIKDVDIRAFLEQISAITGENFVVDPAVTGRVSVIANTPMNPSAIHELFLTVLRVNGFAAVPSGTATRIVPLANARGGVGDAGDTSSQRIVTRVIPAKNVSIEDAVRMLRPMVSPTGFLEGSAYSNAIMISDYADNVTQVAAALDALGRDAPAEVEVIPLRSAWVGDIVPLIEAIGPGQLGANNKGRNRLRVMADERSNSIIVRGDVLERTQVRELVRKLDQKSPNSSNIQMFRLKNSDARSMAQLLRGIVFGQRSNAPAGNTPSAGGPVPPLTSPAVAGDANAATLSNLFSAAPTPDSRLAPQEEAEHSLIQADTALNAVVVRAPPSVMSEVRALIEQLDVRRPQVMIEAAIVEITLDKANRLGVQWAGGDLARSIQSGTTNFTDPSGVSLSLGALLEDLGNTVTPGEGLVVSLGTKGKFDVLIQALSRTANANLLSTPSITTLDNEEAKIVVGQNVPFRTGSFTTLNSGVTNPFTTIERQDIGITLKVVPQIHSGNLVKLNIEQEVSSIAEVQLGTAADLITNKRTINTKVLAQDGETVVLGGLIQDDARDGISKVPLLGDIPVLGTLFSHKRQDAVKRNLFVFLRPTVLMDSTAAEGATQRQYARVYDLQLGKRSLEDEPEAVDVNVDAEVTPKPLTDAQAVDVQVGKVQYMESDDVPPAGSIFNAPPKTLPWLIE